MDLEHISCKPGYIRAEFALARAEIWTSGDFYRRISVEDGILPLWRLARQVEFRHLLIDHRMSEPLRAMGVARYTRSHRFKTSRDKSAILALVAQSEDRVSSASIRKSSIISNRV